MPFKTRKKIIRIVAFAVFATSLFIGCFLPVPGFRETQGPNPQQRPATPPPRAPRPRLFPRSTPEQAPPSKQRGVYHTVQSGETIFRISKMYDVSQETIIAANKIDDVTKVRSGQVLFIPGAKKVLVEPDSPYVAPRPVVPPTPIHPTPMPQPHPLQPPQPPPLTPQPLPPPTEPPPEAPPTNVNGKCKPDSINFIWPTMGSLSSEFGIRHGRQHDGIDVTNKIGTPVYAAADGVVIYSDRLGGYGLIVIIKHAGEIKTIYAHNRENLARKGQTVRQGDKIAEIGNSGNATGPHLHFEIRCGQDAVDPLPYLPKR